MSENFVISLNSNNASNGLGIYGGDITYSVNSPELFSIESFRVKQCIVENSWYNVTSIAADGGRGWYLSLDVTGNVGGLYPLINITPGAYSNLELASQIASQILATTGNTVTVSFVGPTQQMVITRTAGPDTLLTINAGGTNIGWQRLGFTAQQGPSGTLTGTQAYQLNVTQTARVHFQTMGSLKSQSSIPATATQTTGVYQSGVIVSIPVATVNSWTSVVMQIPTDFFNCQPETITRLQFRLTDDQDRPLVLTRSPWSIDLEVRANKK